MDMRRPHAIETQRKIINSYFENIMARRGMDAQHSNLGISWTDLVQMFHLFYKQEHHLEPTHMDMKTTLLRRALINEEFLEFADAADQYIKLMDEGRDLKHPGDKQTADELYVEMADALGDLIVVILGTCVSMGLPINRVMTEIMLSNFSKAGADGLPIFREDGKVLKGPNYFAPNLSQIIGPIKEKE